MARQQDHFVEDGKTLCGNPNLRRSGYLHKTVTEVSDYESITCSKCAKILGARLLKGARYEIAECGKGHTYRSAYEIVIDGVPVAFVASEFNGGWAVTELCYRRTKEGDAGAFIAAYPNWNMIYCFLRDREPRTSTLVHKHLASKDLAILYVLEHLSDFMPYDHVMDFYNSFYSQRDGEEAERQARLTAQENAENRVRAGLEAIRGRNDLSEDERYAVKVMLRHLKFGLDMGLGADE